MRYLCVFNKYLLSLIEFCMDWKRGFYGIGMIINFVMNIKSNLLSVNNDVLNILFKGKWCFDCFFLIFEKS